MGLEFKGKTFFHRLVKPSYRCQIYKINCFRHSILIFYANDKSLVYKCGNEILYLVFFYKNYWLIILKLLVINILLILYVQEVLSDFVW